MKAHVVFQLDSKHESLSRLKKMFLSFYPGPVGMRLFQVFYELVINIYRYAYNKKNDGPVEVVFEERGKGFYLELRDKGKPVAQEDLDRMTSAMNKSRSFDKAVDFSGGDGLYMVRTMTTNMVLAHFDEKLGMNCVSVETDRKMLKA